MNQKTAIGDAPQADQGIDALRALSRAVGARIRFARAARVGASLGAIGAVSVAVAVTAERVHGLPGGTLGTLAVVGLGLPVVAALASAARRIPSLLPASLIDRTHSLSGRVSVALELADGATEDPMSRLAIADAVSRSSTIVPSRAFPITAPRHLRALVLALGALVVAFTLERPRVETVLAPVTPPRLEALLVHPDDLDARRDAVERLEIGQSPTDELRRAIEGTNELLEALSDRTLDRAEAMRRIAALEEALSRPRPPSLVAREEALEAMGDRLGRGELTSSLAEALREHDAAGAADAMRTLAERTRTADMSASERRALREALQELAAMHETEEQQAELRDAEDALAEQERAPESEERESLLERRQEEVERLREEHEQRMEAERQLERLERELEEALEALSGEDGEQEEQAADSMEDAAEELNRTAREQASEEEMEQLRQQLEQLREMIRRQRPQQMDGGGGEGEGEGEDGRGGQGGSSPMDRFVLRARGGSQGTDGMSIGTPSGSGGGGGGESEGGTGEGGEEEEGTPGGASGSSPGGEGEGGEGEETGEQMLVVGEGGDATLELPGFGRGHGPPTGGGQGEDGHGDGAGSEHRDGVGEETERGGDHTTVAVHGEDQGRGPSRSEVIRGGAARGFASRDYERVYAEYAQHAEQEIEEDEIPPGYRFYVRRYFELIRPR